MNRKSRDLLVSILKHPYAWPPCVLLRPAEQFFLDHAGYSYDPKRETETQGKRRCAAELARAEANGRTLGYSFEWGEDETDSSDFSDKQPPRKLWCCLCRNVHGKVLSSLSGIDFGRDKEPWDEPYRRVIEAELAQEALP